MLVVFCSIECRHPMYTVLCSLHTRQCYSQYLPVTCICAYIHLLFQKNHKTGVFLRFIIFQCKICLLPYFITLPFALVIALSSRTQIVRVFPCNNFLLPYITGIYNRNKLSLTIFNYQI